jgi:hypothetical protein
VILDNPRNLPIDRGPASDDQNMPRRSLPPAAKALTQDDLGNALDAVGEAIANAIHEIVPELIREQLPEVLDGIEEKIALRAGRIVQFELEKITDVIEEKFAQQMDELREHYEARLRDVKSEQFFAMKSLHDVINHIAATTPQPVFNVPPTLVKLLPQEAPVVNIPHDAIRVTAEAPPPRTTRTTKEISYGPDGRPSTITELLTEEE